MGKKIFLSILLIITVLLYSLFFYITGILNEIKTNDISLEEYVNSGGDFSKLVNVDSSLKDDIKKPLFMIWTGIITGDWLVKLIFFTLITFAIIKLWIYVMLYKDYFMLYLQRGGRVIDKKGTYGTASWLTPEKLKEYLKKNYVTMRNGLVLGSLINPNKTKKVDYRKYFITQSNNKRFNKNTFVFASSGSGKDYSFINSSVINLLKSNIKDLSFLFTDPKGGIYKKLAGILRFYNFKVYLLNFVSMKNSDRFNVLDLIDTDLDVEVIVDVIMKNTRIQDGIKKSGGDPFWDDAEVSILKAIIALYKFYIMSYVNLPMVFDLINDYSHEHIDSLFEDIPNTEYCKKMFNTYNKASDSLKQNILLGLCSRLSILSTPSVRDLTERTDIDILDLKKRNTALFVCIPDTHNSYTFLVSLFHTMVGIKVIEFTDRTKEKEIKDREIYGFYNEIANIGKIPNFDGWITTFRERNFILIPIFQDVVQAKMMFMDKWQSVYGNCDTKICLGVGDLETAEFVSKQLGEQSIRVMTKFKENGVFNMFNDKHWSQADQKRNLRNADELINDVDIDELIVFRKGCSPMKLYKTGWDIFRKEFKLSEETEMTIFEYTPDWAKKIGEKKESTSSEIVFKISQDDIYEKEPENIYEEKEDESEKFNQLQENSNLF